jgi:hypothetical protein
VIERIAAPMVGWGITPAILGMIMYPVIYLILKKKEMGVRF